MLAEWLLIFYNSSKSMDTHKVTEQQCKAVIEQAVIKKRVYNITCVSPTGQLIEYDTHYKKQE